MFVQLFQGSQYPVRYLNGCCYLQFVMQSSPRWLGSFEGRKIANILGVMMYYHGLSFVESFVWYKSMRALHSAAVQSGTTIGIVTQVIGKALGNFVASFHCGLCPRWLRFISYFDQQLVRSTVLSLRVDGIATITQSPSLEQANENLSNLSGVCWEACSRSNRQDSALCSSTYALSDML